MPLPLLAGPANGKPSIVPSSAASVILLSANYERRGATIFNDSTVTLYVLLSDRPASTTVYTVQVLAASYYEVPFSYVGAITGIWASANGNARVTELI